MRCPLKTCRSLPHPSLTRVLPPRHLGAVPPRLLPLQLRRAVIRLSASQSGRSFSFRRRLPLPTSCTVIIILVSCRPPSLHRLARLRLPCSSSTFLIECDSARLLLFTTFCFTKVPCRRTSPVVPPLCDSTLQLCTTLHYSAASIYTVQLPSAPCLLRHISAPWTRCPSFVENKNPNPPRSRPPSLGLLLRPPTRFQAKKEQHLPQLRRVSLHLRLLALHLRRKAKVPPRNLPKSRLFAVSA